MATKIPQTKNEAFTQLDAMLSDKEKSEMVKTNPIEYTFHWVCCGFGTTGSMNGKRKM